MTVTQRRVKNDPSAPDDKIATEPGIKYTCDFCHVDITHTVRIKCAVKECEEVDMCPSCFCEGKEGQRHKAWHAYKVVEQHSKPIFTEDWGADEELLLISGLILNGLGNWAEAAEHVGTRTKDECERHYLETYLRDVPEGSKQFMPPMHETFTIDPDEFQSRKKRRIEKMRRPGAVPNPANKPPLVSAPTNHEVAGFMPGRLEFEHELENDAELAVKDMEFGLVYAFDGDQQPESAPAPAIEPAAEEEEQVKVKAEPGESAAAPADSEDTDKKPKIEPEIEVEDPDELQLKLAMLEIYYSKLDKREHAKDLIFDRALTEHKKIVANDRKRPKEERELIARYKVFAKLQTAQDFETLVEGLIYEQSLRKRIAELQEYRRNGITTGAEAEAFDIAKVARAGYRPVLPRDRNDNVAMAAANDRRGLVANRFGATPTPDGINKRAGYFGDEAGRGSREPTPRIPGQIGRKPPTPLNLANAQSLDLLTTEEQNLCSALRVLPKPYLTIKEMYIRENERRRGLLKRRDARKMMKIDVNKSGRIFDFLVSSGMLCLAYDPSVKGLGPGKEGHVIGVPLDLSRGFGVQNQTAPAPTPAHEIFPLRNAISNGGP